MSSCTSRRSLRRCTRRFAQTAYTEDTLLASFHTNRLHLKRKTEMLLHLSGLNTSSIGCCVLRKTWQHDLTGAETPALNRRF